MSIDVKIPPFSYTADQWAKLSASERALLIAAQECDTYHSQEVPKGSNRGPRVEAYLASCGLGGGYAWCAAFVYWCVLKAGFTPKIQARSAAGVTEWVKTAKACNAIIDKPKRGCLFAYTKEGHTHIGFVRGVHESAGQFLTVEGNTNDDGSREGYEVAKRDRPYPATGLVFIDLEKLV